MARFNGTTASDTLIGSAQSDYLTGLKIHFLTSAHNSLSQRLQIELAERGHAVTVTLATSEDAMLRSVADYAPELIIAPMLKPAIPEAIWSRFLCIPESRVTAGRPHSTGRS